MQVMLEIEDQLRTSGSARPGDLKGKPHLGGASYGVSDGRDSTRDHLDRNQARTSSPLIE
jgi:hypothetical protein